MKRIPFNVPYLVGTETDFILEAVNSGKISGNGAFTKKCQKRLKESSGTFKCLLTTSCTDALEMSSILSRIEPGDEVIMPSYTFVSTANAFILRGAKVVFIDSRNDHPGMDEQGIESLITEKTKAIVPVHYAGVACDMGIIMEVANRHNIMVIEDAAQAIDSTYTWPDGRVSQLGAIGALGTYSFHETKNVQCGEGGALLINQKEFAFRSEIIWEKGTNRTAFWRGEVDKYGWVDIGSSFLPSDLSAAFLYAQLMNVEHIQSARKRIWNRYNDRLQALEAQGKLRTPEIPGFATNNAHMYYIICKTLNERNLLIKFLSEHGVQAVFHYQPLHASSYYQNQHGDRKLKNASEYGDCLLRLPLFNTLSNSQVDYIIDHVMKFYEN
ncbi:MAG: dTDP-4-amino-4,6-dideoxygalactose transaminase [Flavobacteriales bacterium]|jgi:dTDP-4-amino-4,6-dideoxygalactose transaminase